MLPHSQTKAGAGPFVPRSIDSFTRRPLISAAAARRFHGAWRSSFGIFGEGIIWLVTRAAGRYLPPRQVNQSISNELLRAEALFMPSAHLPPGRGGRLSRRASRR